MNPKGRPRRNLTIQELLSYNPDTGEFRWKKDRGGSAVVGSIAGWTTIHGYRMISIGPKKHYAHRLAWFYVTGVWPENYIDHINGNKSDNRITNLRQATQSQNMANSRIRSNNKSGFKGVSWSKDGNYWAVFLANRYIGSFSSLEKARSVYCKAAREKFGAFWRPE